MSETRVEEILAAHAAHESATAGQRLKAILAKRGMSTASFVQLAYGDKSATTAPYSIMKHDATITHTTARRWEAALNLAEGTFPSGPRGRKTKTKRKTKAVSKAAAPAVAWTPPKPIRPAPAAPVAPAADLFSLTVDQENRASLKLSLVSIPVEQAMRVLAALGNIGVLGHETVQDPQRLNGRYSEAAATPTARQDER